MILIVIQILRWTKRGKGREDSSPMLVPALGKELMVTGPAGLLTLPDSPTWEEPIINGESKVSNFGSRFKEVIPFDQKSATALRLSRDGNTVDINCGDE